MELAKLWRRRGVPKGSITRIETRLNALEGEHDHPNVRDSARQMLAKLKEHDAEFRRIHVTVIDLIDDDDTLITEQALLDEHDDLVASLTVCIMTLADSANPSSTKTISESVRPSGIPLERHGYCLVVSYSRRFTSTRTTP